VGRATFDVRTEGAAVSLVSDLERKELSDLSKPIVLEGEQPAPPGPLPVRAGTRKLASCSVNFNTIPMSTVAVDGVRLGATPILGAAVRPGTHTAQFLAGDVKRSKPFACRPGESKVVTLVLSR
jgi:hypothetical protein